MPQTQTIQQFNSPPVTSRIIRVDEEKGILYNVKIVEVGEAKGHFVNVEQEFLNKVAQLGNSAPNGIKVRYDHQYRSLGTYGQFAGRSKNYKVHQGYVTADIHLDMEVGQSANKEKLNYTIQMSKNNPDMFGISIAFEHGIPYQYDDDGNKQSYRIKVENTYVRNPNWSWERKTFATIEKLLSNDFVDDPAATTSLFSKEDTEAYFSSKFNFNIMPDTPQTQTIEVTKEEKTLFDKFKSLFSSKSDETTRPAITPPVETPPAPPQVAPPTTSAAGSEQFATVWGNLQTQMAQMQTQFAEQKKESDQTIAQLTQANKDLQTQLANQKVAVGNAESAIDPTVLNLAQGFDSLEQWAEAQKVQNSKTNNSIDAQYKRHLDTQKAQEPKAEV